MGNQLIHFVFVPPLLISGTAMSMSLLGALWRVHDAFFYFHFSVWCAMYPMTYIYLDLLCGISWLPIAAVSWLSAEFVADRFGFVAVSAFFVLSFLAQILSHFFIEGTKPAFYDSLYQSLVLAPLFVWCEGVIFPLGLRRKVQTNVARKIKLRKSE